MYPVDDDWRATILLDTVPFDGWVFQGFTLQGRKHDQWPPDPAIPEVPGVSEEKPAISAGFNIGFLTAPPPGYDLEGYNSAPFIPNVNVVAGYEKHNLLIHHLVVRDYASQGISVRNVIDAQVLDNVLEDMGCHHACENHTNEDNDRVCDAPFVGLPEQDPETLCGTNLGQAGMWGRRRSPCP